MSELPLDQYPGYFVSDTGLVRGPRGIMSPEIVKRGGHSRVRIRGKKHWVHHLVLQAFGPPKPNGAITRHLDGDASNNAISNLAWGTPRENYDDIIKHGVSKRPAPVEDIFFIKYLRDLGLLQKDIKSITDIPQPTISRWLINYV
jgi:hypothetical protein